MESFFSPKSVAIVGVSTTPSKLGSIIFTNLQKAKFKGRMYPVNSKTNGELLYGEKSYSSIRDIPEPLDLAVIVVPSKICSSVIDDCIANKTKNISIISAGFSEVGNRDLEREITKKCLDNNINMLGPNCLGYISTHSNLNTSFAAQYPIKGNVAFISQSGAYCSAMLDWANKRNVGFSHFLSIGNKAILSEDKLLEFLKKDPNTNAFVFYLEGIKNGQAFMKVLKEVSKVKPCVIMEPGKSQKAQKASLSHTGSLAPNYKVLQKAIQESGAIQADNTREMFTLLEILQLSNNLNFDGKIAILTNGGGVGVVSTDLCEEYGLDQAKPSESVIKKLKEVIPLEGSCNNPIDILGDATPERYEKSLKILCQSNEYFTILIILTPQVVSSSKSIAEIIVKYAREYKNINFYASFIGGDTMTEGIEYLKNNNVVHFEYPVDCISLLGKLKKQVKYKNTKQFVPKIKSVPENIKKLITSAKNKNLQSLPQNSVNTIMDYYKIDYPKSNNFTSKKEAFDFCKSFFPKKLVMKLSSPDALHKTEMKGIYLDIDSEEKFNNAWNNLNSSIKKFNLKNASILVQEMIERSAEIFIGVNSDNNFGKVMVFGFGGIYTEILKDTTIRILPTNDFNEMIKETKIGAILNGVRGEDPKAIDPLISTLQKVQQLVLENPEIVSVDLNPVLVTLDRAVVVDFKILLK